MQVRTSILNIIQYVQRFKIFHVCIKNFALEDNLESKKYTNSIT